MLILSRERTQKVYISRNFHDPLEPVIEVSVVDIRGSHVRLGFEAPADFVIQREENLKGRKQR